MKSARRCIKSSLYALTNGKRAPRMHTCAFTCTRSAQRKRKPTPMGSHKVQKLQAHTHTHTQLQCWQLCTAETLFCLRQHKHIYTHSRRGSHKVHTQTHTYFELFIELLVVDNDGDHATLLYSTMRNGRQTPVSPARQFAPLRRWVEAGATKTHTHTQTAHTRRTNGM